MGYPKSRAEVVELADARDSKSRGPRGRAGSTPAFGTNTLNHLSSIPVVPTGFAAAVPDTLGRCEASRREEPPLGTIPAARFDPGFHKRNLSSIHIGR